MTRRVTSKAHRRIWLLIIVMLTLFMSLSIANELLDIPHYLFGDKATSLSQRKGEVIFETCIYIVVISVAFVFYKKLQTKIKILEGFIPICANCKKIRQDKTLENFDFCL